MIALLYGPRTGPVKLSTKEDTLLERPERRREARCPPGLTTVRNRQWHHSALQVKAPPSVQ